jgi:2-pyrone-4,6-dicarboxylate lactonase
MNRTDFYATPPGFMPPRGSCDSHVHLFGPAEAYPYADGRTYTPFDALPEDCREMMRLLGLTRVVLVQPSTYGLDHRRLLDGLEYFQGSARGVAVLSGHAARQEVRRLHEAGVRGARINFNPASRPDPDDLQRVMHRMAALIGDFGWHLQISMHNRYIQVLESTIMHLPVAVVLEHMAHLPMRGFENTPGYSALRRMLDRDRLWLKLSGAYRITGEDTRPEGAGALARHLINVRSDRILWGSDWPHTPAHGLDAVDNDICNPYRRIDTGKLLALLQDWAPGDSVLRGILVDNPQRLYGFHEQ